MSTNYPRLSAGILDAPQRGRMGTGQKTRTRTVIGAGGGGGGGGDGSVVTAVMPISAQTYGDRLLADTHLSKCALLRVVHRFMQEYAAHTRRHGADLYIKVCSYRVSSAPRSAFDSAARANLLRPNMEWCPLYLTHHTDLEDARVNVVLRPYAPEAVVTLPQVAQPPSAAVTGDVTSVAPVSMLQVGGVEFAICEPLTMGITVVCNGAAVDRSMRPSHLHDLTHKAAAAHRAGKSAGLFYHALAQEPVHDWQSPEDVCMPTEYLSKTSEGVHVVLYNAGRGEREHPLTRQMLPTIAVALRDIHLSMDGLFSTSDPPRWPMALAFMQLCKTNSTPGMLDRAKAVMEAYRAARDVQHEMEDAFLCSEYVSDDTYGIPAYRQLEERHISCGSRMYDPLEDVPPERTGAHHHHHHSRHYHHRMPRHTEHDSKPQCAIC